MVWIRIGIQNLGKLNIVAMTALFALTVILSAVIFRGEPMPTATDNSMSFGAAVELAVAMPLSWLPLISDYTRSAAKPGAATAASAIAQNMAAILANEKFALGKFYR